MAANGQTIICCIYNNCIFEQAFFFQSFNDIANARVQMADKGIIITTGFFTKESKSEAVRDGVPPMELVDGEKLIDLLIKYELGVKPVATYEVDDSFYEEYRS